MTELGGDVPAHAASDQNGKEPKKLVVLDLDNTLVYVDHPEFHSADRSPDFGFRMDDGDSFSVWKRPGLDAFLAWCFRNYAVAIWSASCSEYVDLVLTRILPEGCVPVFVWCSERCTARALRSGLFVSSYDCERIVVKNLRKVTRRRKRGFGKNDVIVVDDNRHTYMLNYGNALPIDGFWGSDADAELARIKDALEKLRDCTNLRRVEKRKGARDYLSGIATVLE
jgi:RNA polymerase II subunit A small phosphatase-like protein